MDSIIPLTSTDIHVWLASYGEIVDERLHAAYRQLLNAAEREQEPRFYFARDRLRYLVTRALVRTVLSRYMAIDPEDWVFSTNAYGRPEIANPQVSDAGFSFNISHTHSLIVLGVTKQRALGVDVENILARQAAIDVANRYFAPPEVAALHASPRQEQQQRFFEYWTFKESYIKARGMGLSLPLDKFSFHYRDEKTVEIAIDRELTDEPARWQFWQLQPAPEYLVAICAERTGAPSPHLTVRWVVPMLSEDECTLPYLRVSESCLNATQTIQNGGSR
ncbi:MAG TPA: 4'-phosphopantetheinyl transferase superfamily protein [Thermoanaerobaculia bacterium]|jgi:4'-phosphopantetheinyl transferase|nr:4'-phosphopantetheinyl transferase superfamily protein [Thermoanaerobaculia bacterium]